MMLPVVFRGVARTEFDHAGDWYEMRRYEMRRRGLGAAFSAAVDVVVARLASQPEFYPFAFKDIREAIVSGYPYCIYYRVELSQIVILSVFHASRDPAVWQTRD